MLCCTSVAEMSVSSHCLLRRKSIEAAAGDFMTRRYLHGHTDPNGLLYPRVRYYSPPHGLFFTRDGALAGGKSR